MWEWIRVFSTVESEGVQWYRLRSQLTLSRCEGTAEESHLRRCLPVHAGQWKVIA